MALVPKRRKLKLESLAGISLANAVKVLEACESLQTHADDNSDERASTLLNQLKWDNKCLYKRSHERFLIKADAVNHEGGSLSIWYSRFAEVLQYKVEQSKEFGALLENQIFKHGEGGQDVQMLVYHDEAVPGNALHPDNARKTTLLYISFVGFGKFLRVPHAWTTCGLIRHQNSVELSAGLSEFVRHFLWTLLPPTGTMLTVGEAIIIRNRTYMLRVASIKVYADEAALKGTLGSKGASGNKPCHLCTNLLKKLKLASIVQRAGQEFFVTYHAKPAELVPLSNQSIYEILDHLATLRYTARLGDEETLHGWSDLPEGLLQDAALREHIKPRDHRFGCMHVYLSNGVANDEVALFFLRLQAVKATGLTPEEFCVYACSGWKGATASSLKAACNPLLFKDSGYKGNASQLFVVLPLLASFAMEVVLKSNFAGEMLGAADSLQALAAVVFELRCIKSISGPDTSKFRALQLEFREKHIACYGVDHLKPKFHMQFHLPDQVDEDGFVVDEFAMEAKHILFKRDLAPKQTRLDVFEEFILLRMIIAETHLLAEYLKEPPDSLQGKVCLEPSLQMHVSCKFRFQGREFCKGDVIVMLVPHCRQAIVHCCIQAIAAVHADSGIVLIAETLQFVARFLLFVACFFHCGL